METLDARRVLLFVQVLTLLGVVAFVWKIGTGSRVPVAFDIRSPNALPVLRQQSGPHCDDLHGDARMFVYCQTAKGARVRVELCFRSVPHEGKRMIPYAMAEDGDMLLVGERFSDNVNVYIKEFQNNFALPDAVGRMADAERKVQVVRYVAIAAVGALVAWFGWSLLAWVTGRVARELASIPAGRDARP